MLNKLNFDVAQFTSNETYRRELQAVNVTPSHTEATNGHYAVRVTATDVKPEQFPLIPGETIETEFSPFLISSEDAKRVSKAIPRSKTLPVLEHAAICINGFEHAKIAVTDLDSPQVLQPRKIEGRYPSFDVITPKSEPVLTISVNPEYLAKLMSFAAKFDKASVKLTFYGSDRPIKIESPTYAEEQQMTALLMPLRP